MEYEAGTTNIQLVVMFRFMPKTMINTFHWDPEFEMIRVRGTLCWLRDRQGKVRRVHREKVRAASRLDTDDIYW